MYIRYTFIERSSSFYRVHLNLHCKHTPVTKTGDQGKPFTDMKTRAIQRSLHFESVVVM